MTRQHTEQLGSIATDQVAALKRCLATAQRPMIVARMSHWHRSRHKAIIAGTDELAVRTARSLRSFEDPLILSSLASANAARLRWARTFSAREFHFCTGLEVLARQYVEQQEKHNEELASHASSIYPKLDLGTVTMSCSAHGCHRLPTQLTNTDDDSPLFADPDTMGTSSSSSASKRLADFTDEGRPGRPVEPFSTLSDAERALSEGRINLDNTPFEVSLQILRPQQPLLNIMVNEIAIRSAGLNHWFSWFCRRRVAWRVLHEHLLHVTRPDLYVSIVNDATNIREVLKEACEVVADLYSKVSSHPSDNVTVTFHVEEDASILSTPPPGKFLSSSAEHDDGRDVVEPAQLPAVSDRVYSVEGHLAYTFRELLKNACVASLKVQNEVAVTMRYAEDDRWVVVDFVDEAHGISPAHADDIWKFGWTTSEHYESHLGGFGVGLPISKVYMDMWGGSIRVYSEVGHGTVARVRFPKSPVEVLVPDSTLPHASGSDTS